MFIPYQSKVFDEDYKMGKKILAYFCFFFFCLFFVCFLFAWGFFVFIFFFLSGAISKCKQCDPGFLPQRRDQHQENRTG